MGNYTVTEVLELRFYIGSLIWLQITCPNHSAPQLICLCWVKSTLFHRASEDLPVQLDFFSPIGPLCPVGAFLAPILTAPLTCPLPQLTHVLWPPGARQAQPRLGLSSPPILQDHLKCPSLHAEQAVLKSSMMGDRRPEHMVLAFPEGKWGVWSPHSRPLFSHPWMQGVRVDPVQEPFLL